MKVWGQGPWTQSLGKNRLSHFWCVWGSIGDGVWGCGDGAGRDESFSCSRFFSSWIGILHWARDRVKLVPVVGLVVMMWCSGDYVVWWCVVMLMMRCGAMMWYSGDDRDVGVVSYNSYCLFVNIFKTQ